MRTPLIVTASILVLTALAAYYFSITRPPELPQTDLSAMEPLVGERIRTYSNAVRSNPDDAAAWANLAQVFHAHELFPQALAAYREAMELNPQDSRWPYLAALAQTKSDIQAALPLFRQAVALQPANAAVYINFGDVLMRLDQPAEAEQAYSQALTIDSTSTHALYGLAQAALARDDVEAALALLLRAESLAPQHGEVHSLLAQLYQRSGDGEAARREAMLARAWPNATRAPDPAVEAMESLAVDSQSLARKGASLARRGQFNEAEAVFREVLAIRPGTARDYANLGGALAGQGRLEEALAAYRSGLEIDPADVDSLNNLGYTLLQLRRYDEAGKHLQKAVDIDPGFAPALGNLGLLAAQRGEGEAAIGYYVQALEHDPGLLFARSALAAQWAAAGEDEAAAGEWRRVLDIDPNDLAALYNLATIQASRGEHAEAIVLLRRGLDMAPNSSRLVAALAWELATAPTGDLRNGAEALQLAQRLVEAYPDRPGILDVQAAALAETGDFDNAVKVMERVVALAATGDPSLAMRLEAYRLGRPWRQAGATTLSAAGPSQQP